MAQKSIRLMLMLRVGTRDNYQLIVESTRPVGPVPKNSLFSLSFSLSLIVLSIMRTLKIRLLKTEFL